MGNNKNLSLYPSELAAIRHYAANCDSQDVPAYQADDGYAKRGAPRSHHFSTIANIEEDSPGVDPPWNRRRCRGWICRLLHGPKASSTSRCVFLARTERIRLCSR